MTAFLPSSAGDFPAEVRERLDRMESAARMSDVGGAGGSIFTTTTPVVGSTFLDPVGFLPGPACTIQVPPSHRLLVTMSMTATVNITADATPITASIEATVESTSGAVITASAINGLLWEVTSITNQPLVSKITLSRQVLFSDLDALPTRLKMSYRASTTNPGKSVLQVLNRTISAVAL
ncbi:hypothetical protein UFOVP1360_9 [uncultured Caudovirales phage]|uniref:Uncharacterized protein n=1 Tax=uncultured Caudovirales phage TaxID=2100421 RepID=A0A6J5S4N0_9CAUD|nr:hypothetical protein UFOVP1360_9 [uncultured Caudovirales phage]